MCSLAVCNCALSHEGITAAFRAAPANGLSGQRSPLKNTTFAGSFCCFQKMTLFVFVTAGVVVFIVFVCVFAVFLVVVVVVVVVVGLVLVLVLVLVVVVVVVVVVVGCWSCSCCCCCCCCCCCSVGVIVLNPVAKISSLNFLNACCFVTGKTTSVRRRLLAEIIWTKLPKHWNS